MHMSEMSLDHQKDRLTSNRDGEAARRAGFEREVQSLDK